MAELNVQYPNAMVPAMAAQQIVGNQQRNALLANEDQRRQQELSTKLAQEALTQASLYADALENLPEDVRAKEWPVAVGALKQIYGGKGISFVDNAPDQYDPAFFNQALTHMKGLKTQASLKRASTQDPYADMKTVQDPSSPTGWSYMNPQGRGMAGAPAPREPSTNINMPPTEREEGKEWGKAIVKDYSEINERARSSEGLVQQLEVARGIDVQKGAIEPFKARIQRWVESLPGGESFKGSIADATSAQALTGIMQNIVLSKMQAQKGPQTENDARRIEMTVANLGNTPEAFDFLMGAALALEKRNIDQRNFYLKYREANQTLEGAASAWESFKSQTPLMIKNPKTSLPVFYYDFRNANPDVPEDVLLKKWREASRG
jgi:hypothetical protein